MAAMLSTKLVSGPYNPSATGNEPSERAMAATSIAYLLAMGGV